jgi:hypothetical protein
VDYSKLTASIKNKDIINTILSEEPSNIYDGATSYQSKYSNLVDNYSLSRKLKSNYMTYLDLLKGKAKAHNSVVKLVDTDLSSANAGNNIDNTYSQNQVATDFVEMIDSARAKELIKLYFSQYIGKLRSDMQWRLGNFIDNTADIDENMLIDGKYPSRGFIIPTKNESIYNGKNLEKDDSNFVHYGFPPYKLELDKNIVDDTDLMASHSSSTFDLDNFTIDREEFTYREMGMKTLSGYIDYLQYLIEGATGIVSTYMTEWDLSNYMQENLMSVSNNRVDLSLNYRIRQDNPFSDRYEYRGDKALCFNVCGSSVSKLYHDNEKLWLPSDYVYSSWWTPYLEGIDFDLRKIHLKELNYDIKYMDCYDTFDVAFDYDSQNNILDIIKHQDILQTITSCKTSFTSRYYDAFYSTSEDALSDYDIMLDDYVKEAAGSKYCRNISALIQDCKVEMLCAGGYENALYSSSFSQGGLFGKRAIRNALEKTGEYTKNDILEQKSQEDSADIDVASDGIVNDLLKSKNNNGATLAKMDGISRFSPSIYGGNHGACYSLNSLRGHFENTILNLNTPTINIEEYKDDFANLEAKYINKESPQICRSPTKNKNTLFKGDLNWTYSFGIKTVKVVNEEIEANISINRFNGNYEFTFPTYINNSQVVYSSDKQYTKRKTICVTDILEGKNELKEKLNYLSVYNNNTTVVPDKYDPSKKYATIEIPCKKASYYKSKLAIIKMPIINDNPDLNWAIYLHKFDEYSADTKMTGDFIRNILLAKKTLFKSDKITKEAMSQKPGFILRFPGNPDLEQEFIKNMMWYGKGTDNKNPIYLYFLEGNKRFRYQDGPESIFKAPCYVKYYDAEIKKESFWKKLLRIITFNPQPKKTNIPYIYVDLYNATDFYDKLNSRMNTVPDSGFKPLHISNDGFFRKVGSEYVSPIQKIHKIGTNVLTSQKGKTSISNTGLEGIGILTGLIGLDTQAQDILNIDDKDINFDNGLGVKYNENTSLENLPLYTASVEEPKSWYKEKDGKKYMSKILADQKYVKKPYDIGLRKAYTQMITRLTMFKYGDETYLPYFLDISAPYKNILSVLVSHKNYLSSINSLVSYLGADYIHDLLIYNVDRCVLFACGMTFTKDGSFSIGNPYKTHILYNYWIDKAVHTLGNLSTARQTVKNIQNSVKQFVSLADKYINDLKKILDKSSTKWTIKEIKLLNEYLASIKETFYKRNDIDDFMLTYINILYYYRLFYIGNRFNKVDGTMWRMRHLEAALNLTKQPNIILPKSPNDFQIKPERHSVAFYEIQNTTAMKTDSIINKTVLDKDRIYRIYIKVNYTTKEAFEKWCAYRDNPDQNERVQEVNRYLVDGEYKYVLKPADGIYQFRSKEYNENEKNIEWNKRHINDIPKSVWSENIDCKFNIVWHNSEDKTPIRWDVLGNINVDNLLEYAPMGITGEDLVCLIEEGADFWTVNIPEGLWPEKSHYLNNLYIKQVFENETNNDISKDAYVSVLGPFAHSVSPIISDPMDVSLNFTNKLI